MTEIKYMEKFLGPFCKISLDEFAWYMYVCNAANCVVNNGYLITYSITDNLMEAGVLVLIRDIIFTKHMPKKDDKYLELNLKTHKARTVPQVPDTISERDECDYLPLIRTPTYFSNLCVGKIEKNLQEEK